METPKWAYSSSHQTLTYTVRVGNFRLSIFRRHGISETWKASLYVGSGTYWSGKELDTLDLVTAKRSAVRLLRETLSGVLSDLVTVPVEEDPS